MKKSNCLFILAAIIGNLLLIQSAAAQILHEATFDRNGLNEVINVHTDGGEISVVNNPDGSGRVLRAYRDQNDRRAEVRVYSCELEEYWYGFRLFVPNNYPGVTRRTHINQWHAGGGSEPEGGFRKIDGNGQPYGFKIDENDEFVMSFAYLVAKNTLQYKYIHTGIKWSDHKGKWLNWAIHANWSTSNDGFAEVFFEGKSVGRYNGKTWGHLGNDPMWKVGSYSGSLKGDATLYFDDLYVGDERASLSDVNPRLSNGGGGGGGNPNEQTAYQGPHTIPGKLEAEHYDNGGEGVAFRDTDAGNRGGCGRNDNVDLQAASDEGGGCNVGWTRGGEWLEYTMAQVSGGIYNLNVRLASGSNSPGTLTVKLAGRTLGTIDVANTGGWQNYVTRTLSNIRLAQGSNQVLRLEITQGSFNINWMRFTKVATPQPVGGTLLPIADAYVRGNGEQDGSGEALLIKQGGSSSYERVSYLKFDLSGYTSAQISSATLRLYCTELQDNSTRTTVAVHGSADNWTEQGITWQNKPALGNRLGSSVVDRVGRYYAFNVSQYVQGQAAGDKTVSLALVDGGAVNKALFFGSRESGNPPQLVITTTNARQGSGDKAALALEEAAVQVYPNPSTGLLNITGVEGSAQRVQLVNLQGQLLLNKQLEKGQTQLDVSTLPKGLYLIKVGQHSERIILE